MVVPILCIGGWAACITCISELVTPRKVFSQALLDRLTINVVGVSTLLLTVLGFVVALSLSFRSSTAYERYISYAPNTSKTDNSVVILKVVRHGVHF
jgi:ion channel-forming bestrophin family protein